MFKKVFVLSSLSLALIACSTETAMRGSVSDDNETGRIADDTATNDSTWDLPGEAGTGG